MALWVLVCALGAGCSFDPSGFGNGGDDAPGGPDAAPPEAIDASGGGGFDAGPAVPDAAPPPPMPGVLHCPKVTTPPTLDGNLADWPTGGAGFPMANAAQVVDETLAYEPSMAAAFRCLHDGEQVYFGIHVSDDKLVSNSTELYDDDAVHLYIDAAGDASGHFGSDDHEIVVRADGVYQDYAQGASVVSLVGKVLPQPASSSFTVEIALGKASLGAGTPLPSAIGFDLAISDDDGPVSFAYGLWYLSTRTACFDCCLSFGGKRAWCDTTTFGQLVLD